MGAWLRPALVVPVAGSILVHAALLVAIDRIRIGPTVRLTDAADEGVDAVLSVPMAPRPQPVMHAAKPVERPVEKPINKPIEKPIDKPPEQPAAAKAPPRAEPVVNPQAMRLEQTPVPAPVKPVETARPEVPETTAAPATPVTEPAPVEQAAPRPAVFAGVTAKRASKLVYAIDASGAMTTSLPYVKEELLRSVRRLDASQRFQVLVFRQVPGSEVATVESFAASGYATPDAETMSRLASWIGEVQPRGRSQPLAGLRAALSQHPDLIFFLTRSIRRSGQDSAWGEGTRATLEELDRLNPESTFGGRPTVIKALQFLDADPTGMLQQIGATHGDGPGSYAVVRP
jgi:hypothetical protein